MFPQGNNWPGTDDPTLPTWIDSVLTLAGVTELDVEPLTQKVILVAPAWGFKVAAEVNMKIVPVTLPLTCSICEATPA